MRNHYFGRLFSLKRIVTPRLDRVTAIYMYMIKRKTQSGDIIVKQSLSPIRVNIN